MSESSDLVHEQVDAFIYDPISVSLRASIDDEKTAYLDPQKVDRHSLFDAKTLDIWDSPNGPRRLDRSYPLSRNLPDQLFDAWHPSARSGERLALRLLITRPMQASTQVSWHDDLGKPDDRQINFLPFTPEAIQDLIHQYDLPRSWTWMRLNSREVGNYIRKTEWDFSVVPPRAVRMGMVIHFPFVLRPAKRIDYLNEEHGGKPAGRRTTRKEYYPRRDDPFIWSLAMSHSLRDGKTRGLLDGITDFAYGDISQRILKAKSYWYQHPLHVPIILLDIFFEHAAWEVNRLAKDVAEFEDLSRVAETTSLEQYDAITTEMQFVRRNLDYQQNLAKFLIETLTFLEEKIFARQAQHGMSTYETYVFETNPHMEEKLYNTLHMIENNLGTCEYLQSRTKDSLDYINGLIALRDTASNREDADSNKTMAFLQMAFFPAGFVAAIMSINVFDWTKNPAVVYPTIWVFVVFAVGLTIIVLATYFLAKQRTKQRIKQEQDKAKQVEDKEEAALLQAPEESGPGSGDNRGRRKRRSKYDEKRADGGRNNKPALLQS